MTITPYTAKRNFFSQFTPEQLRTQYRRNLVGLSVLLTKAERTGRKVNGFTVDQLRAMVAQFTELSTATDAQIRDHVGRSTIRATSNRSEVSE